MEQCPHHYLDGDGLAVARWAVEYDSPLKCRNVVSARHQSSSLGVPGNRQMSRLSIAKSKMYGEFEEKKLSFHES